MRSTLWYSSSASSACSLCWTCSSAEDGEQKKTNVSGRRQLGRREGGVIINFREVETYSHRNPTSYRRRSRRLWRTTGVRPSVRQWCSQSTPSPGRRRGRGRAPRGLSPRLPQELNDEEEKQKISM